MTHPNCYRSLTSLSVRVLSIPLAQLLEPAVIRRLVGHRRCPSAAPDHTPTGHRRVLVASTISSVSDISSSSAAPVVYEL